jgi:hypothetical protein
MEACSATGGPASVTFTGYNDRCHHGRELVAVHQRRGNRTTEMVETAHGGRDRGGGAEGVERGKGSL